jgi:sugar fermentation stimulation protein A
MQYPAPLVEGRLLRRYQRFFADVRVGREVVTAHCANPGSMRGCAEVGARVYLAPASNPARKLAWTWELAEHDGALVCVNTARGNQLVAEALAARRLAIGRGFPAIRREVALGDSRIDFRLEAADGRARWIEVKTATMGTGAGGVAFPDSVTTRGTRHVGELTAVDDGVLLFCAARSDARRVRPADEIDPAYGAALRAAAAAGVKVIAHRCEITTTEITLGARIPVDLG